MNRAVTAFAAVTAAGAVAGYLALQQSVVPVNVPPIPSIVRLSATDFRVDWPEGCNPSNYIWSVQIATNLAGPWVEQEPNWDNTTLVFAHPSPPWFLRLHGITNSL